jgi:urease accessory protein
MLIVSQRIAPQSDVDAVLVLTFEQRRKSRLRTKVAGGEDIGLFLERGSVLCDGDCLRADDGRVVRVRAAVEDLLEIRCDDAITMTRAAYHLGNRHAAVEVREDSLRVAADAVLAEMVRGLGATVMPIRAAFHPESGAYGAAAHAHSGEAKHAGIIHDFAHRVRNSSGDGR